MANIWTLPNTLLGFALLPFTGKSDRQGGLHFIAELDSALDKTFNRLRISAMTLGECVLYRCGGFNPVTYEHECEHIRQYKLWGPMFLPAYLVASVVSRVKHGNWYRDNFFERAARRVAGQEV